MSEELNQLEFPAMVTKHWRITVPPEVRRLLRLKEGECVRVILIKVENEGHKRKA